MPCLYARAAPKCVQRAPKKCVQSRRYTRPWCVVPALVLLSAIGRSGADEEPLFATIVAKPIQADKLRSVLFALADGSLRASVFNNGINRATDRAVGTHRAFDFNFSGAVTCCCACSIGFFDQTQLGSRQAHANAQTRTTQKAATVYGRQCLGQTALQSVHKN